MRKILFARGARVTLPERCGSIRCDLEMPQQYIPVLIFAVLAAAFPAVTLLIFQLIRPSSGAMGAKLKPYECGIPAESDSRGRYSVRFYIVAILFVIFDVETVFLFPWAVQYRSLGIYGLISMFVFLGILIVGYVWLYRKGALEWLSGSGRRSTPICLGPSEICFKEIRFAR